MLFNSYLTVAKWKELGYGDGDLDDHQIDENFCKSSDFIRMNKKRYLDFGNKYLKTYYFFLHI